jgi:signal transduction histidine kinase/ribosome maturation factor RimP
MMNAGSPKSSFSSTIKKFVGVFINSRLGTILANIPPFSWIIRRITYQLAGRMMSPTLKTDEPVSDIIYSSALNAIAYDIVEALDYAAVMVATYEQGDALSVRAFYSDPKMITIEDVAILEQEMSARFGALLSPEFCPDGRISLTDPQIARVYINKKVYRDNLGVQAAEKREPIVSNHLFDLFTPVMPEALRSVIDGIQSKLGIRQVVAVPFFIETWVNGKVEEEYIGNLFAAKQGQISEQDVRILSSFARRAAGSISSERQRLHVDLMQGLILDVQRGLVDEEIILQRIVEGVVTELNYPGAMVAIYEENTDALPVRAFYVDPQVIEVQEIKKLEEEISTRFNHILSPKFSPDGRISLTDPEIARVYLHREEYSNNLSVQAAQEGIPIVRDHLFDLFTPIAPQASWNVIRGIQDRLGIRQVIAVPFFIESNIHGEYEREYVGNLFAATQSQSFTQWEIDLLQTFGQQAAAGLKNARLFRQSENRRIAAQIFGKMAFSATASLHALRNHIGLMMLSVQMLDDEKYADAILNDETLRKQFTGPLAERIKTVSELLESLREPFKVTHDTSVDVNSCIKEALEKVDRRMPMGCERVNALLAENLPSITTMSEMLTEAFFVIIKNAVEAMASVDPKERELQIHSQLLPSTEIEVTIRDNGTGIKPEELEGIFELGITTKVSGMGFGLFWTRDFIEGLGGNIVLESEWGKGSLVRVYIPTQETTPDSGDEMII